MRCHNIVELMSAVYNAFDNYPILNFRLKILSLMYFSIKFWKIGARLWQCLCPYVDLSSESYADVYVLFRNTTYIISNGKFIVINFYFWMISNTQNKSKEMVGIYGTMDLENIGMAGTNIHDFFSHNNKRVLGQYGVLPNNSVIRSVPWKQKLKRLSSY